MLEFKHDYPPALTQYLDGGDYDKTGDVIVTPAVASTDTPASAEKPTTDDDAPKIVSLDQFRKK